MRILHGVATDAFAGVERHVARLARAQAAAGHAVHVVGGSPDPMTAELGDDVSHERADGVGSLVRAVRRRLPDVDVLHVHMTAAEVAATLALVGVPAARRPVVVSTRHFARPRGHGASARLVGAVATRRLAAQIAISAHVAAAVDGPTTVVLSGVDPHPDGPTADGRDRSVLLVQRLQPEKRGVVALRAFARSGLAESGWRLDVAGDGAERELLDREAADLGIADRTRFLGRRNDVPDLMRRAGILLAPCDVEGLGLSVLEAMSSRLPVVAAAAGGHLELLDGIGDVCLPATDADSMARSLARLGADPVLRDAVADAALARQRSLLALDAQAAGTIEVYARTLHASQREVAAP